MTRRAVPEWIGKTPDTPVPARVKLRVFDRYDGRCHWSGRKIHVGDKWDVDHVLALCNGGENRENNLAPILRGKPHRDKTREDVRMKAKSDRIRKKHLGIKRGSGPPMPGALTSGWKHRLDGKWERR